MNHLTITKDWLNIFAAEIWHYDFFFHKILHKNAEKLNYNRATEWLWAIALFSTCILIPTGETHVWSFLTKTNML